MPHQRRSKSKHKFHGPLRAEDVLYAKWRRVAKRANLSGSSTRFDSRYAALADKLQYQLQDMSPYGNALVWGGSGMDEARANAMELTRKKK
jgi:hypothetical protein